MKTIFNGIKWAIYAPSDENPNIWTLKEIHNTRSEAKHFAMQNYDNWIIEPFKLSVSFL